MLRCSFFASEENTDTPPRRLHTNTDGSRQGNNEQVCLFTSLQVNPAHKLVSES